MGADEADIRGMKKKRYYYRKSKDVTNDTNDTHLSDAHLSWGLTKQGTRRWTVNRSPHGNKTARDQYGLEKWKRVVATEGAEVLVADRTSTKEDERT